MKQQSFFSLLLILLSAFIFPKTLFGQTDLSVNVSSNSATYVISGYISFDVTVKNLSSNPATGIHCNIPFPTNVSGTSCNHATIGFYENYPVNGTVSGDWKNLTDLAGGDCAVLRFKVYVISGSSFTVSATVSSSTSDTNLSNNTSSITVNQGAASPDNTPDDCSTPLSSAGCPNIVSLALTLMTNMSEVNTFIGNNLRDFPTPESVNYSFTVTNTSPKNATNVQIQVNLPPELTFQSASNGLGTYNSGTGIWTIPIVVGNTATQLSILAYANTGGSINITGQITAVDQPDVNGFPGVSYPTVSKTIIGLLADLSISTPIISNSHIRRGDIFTISTTLTNSGPTRAQGVKVRSFIPVGTMLVSSSATIGVYDDHTGVWLLSTTLDANGNKPGFTIQSGTSETLTLTLQATTFGSTTFDVEVRSDNMPDPNSTPSNGILSENDEQQIAVNVDQALPIELVAFTAKKQKNNIEIYWQTLLEAKLTYFDIEKSDDGLNFKKIGTQKANNAPSEYIFIDNEISSAIIYYRLNINETDGSSYYSKIVTVEGDKKDFSLTKLFPNPADKLLNVEWQSTDNLSVHIFLTDLLGRIIFTNSSDSHSGINQLPLNTDNLPSGFYFLNIEHNGARAVKQFVVR